MSEKTSQRGRKSPIKTNNNTVENSKTEVKESKWNTIEDQNIMYTVNEKGILFIRVDLNSVYKPSKSFYDTGSKKKSNILVASTGGNKKMLNGEFSDLAISVNIYRPMTQSEIKEWSKEEKDV